MQDILRKMLANLGTVFTEEEVVEVVLAMMGPTPENSTEIAQVVFEHPTAGHMLVNTLSERISEWASQQFGNSVRNVRALTVVAVPVNEKFDLKDHRGSGLDEATFTVSSDVLGWIEVRLQELSDARFEFILVIDGQEQFILESSTNLLEWLDERS